MSLSLIFLSNYISAVAVEGVYTLNTNSVGIIRTNLVNANAAGINRDQMDNFIKQQDLDPSLHKPHAHRQETIPDEKQHEESLMDDASAFEEATSPTTTDRSQTGYRADPLMPEQKPPSKEEEHAQKNFQEKKFDFQSKMEEKLEKFQEKNEEKKYEGPNQNDQKVVGEEFLMQQLILGQQGLIGQGLNTADYIFANGLLYTFSANSVGIPITTSESNQLDQSTMAYDADLTTGFVKILTENNEARGADFFWISHHEDILLLQELNKTVYENAVIYQLGREDMYLTTHVGEPIADSGITTIAFENNIYRLDTNLDFGPGLYQIDHDANPNEESNSDTLLRIETEPAELFSQADPNLQQGSSHSNISPPQFSPPPDDDEPTSTS